jgi:chemotaxis protein CheC
MTTAPTLSAEKLDALQELVNIGMGAAGASLAEALGAFVELAIPAIDITDKRNVANLLDVGSWSEQEIEAVRQPFFGAFTGESMMLFDGHVHEQLTGLPGYPAGPEGAKPSAMEHQEVLLDLANAVIGACVNGIAEPLREVVSFAAPSRLGNREDVRAFLSRDAVAWHQGLIVNVDFKLEGRSFLSRVLVFLPDHSLCRIDESLTRLLDGLAAG